MSEPLKEQNRYALRFAVLVNAVVFCALITQGKLAVPSMDHIVANWKVELPAGFAFVATVVLNSLLSPDVKARLVYLRWNDPLPGSRAFSYHATRDTRIDLAGLQRKLGHFPIAPADQNRVWYQLYKAVRNEPAVEHVHREALFLRDYTGLAALALVVLGAAAFLLAQSWQVASGYVGFALVQYVVVRLGAANAGVRMVRTVLAQVTG